MWPFSEMSLETAGRLSNFANLSLIVSLATGVISTFVIVATGNVKEQHWDKERLAAEERISKLDEEAKRLTAAAEASRAQIATAQADVAKAQAAIAQAQSEQEFIKARAGWRILIPKQSSDFVENIKSSRFSVRLLYVDNDPEALSLAMQFAEMFKQSAWKIQLQNITYSRQLLTGILLFIPKNEAFNKVWEALRAARISSGFMEGSSDEVLGVRSDADVTMLIASKPPPF